MAKQVELSVRCVVKGYHECPFEVNVGEIFYAFKKRGGRGNAFRVTNDRGQLGHLQIELVGPLTQRDYCVSLKPPQYKTRENNKTQQVKITEWFVHSYGAFYLRK